MRRGLVIGKFMPLHRGHIALVRFAAAHCDELIVSLSFKTDDPIPGAMRFEWLREEFRIYPKIKVEVSEDTFDNEKLPLKERMPLWAAFLQRRFGPIHLIFSSEEYGPLLADELGISHVTFDPERKEFPVSGSMIRKEPYVYWEYIALPARAWFVTTICFYGPESTGKTMLAQKMAEHYQTQFVPEVAREIVTSNSFAVEDIIRIGRAQTARVIEKRKVANRILFCDTDIITTQIYCRWYLNEVPPALYEMEKEIHYDQYFLFDIDVPWVADGMRDLPHERETMRDIFQAELDKRRIVPIIIRGNYEQRFLQVKAWVDKRMPPPA